MRRKDWEYHPKNTVNPRYNGPAYNGFRIQQTRSEGQKSTGTDRECFLNELHLVATIASASHLALFPLSAAPSLGSSSLPQPTS